MTKGHSTHCRDPQCPLYVVDGRVNQACHQTVVTYTDLKNDAMETNIRLQLSHHIRLGPTLWVDALAAQQAAGQARGHRTRTADIANPDNPDKWHPFCRAPTDPHRG